MALTKTKTKTMKPAANRPPSVRLYRAMSAAGLEVQNLHADLDKQEPARLRLTDLVDALETARNVDVRLDHSETREEQHDSAQDLKDALEDAIAEANMLASEARSIEKSLGRVLAQIQKHDTFKLPKGRN